MRCGTFQAGDSLLRFESGYKNRKLSDKLNIEFLVAFALLGKCIV